MHTRKRMIMIDESFTCRHCGAAVQPLGTTARDHCPQCLHGSHVDGDIPGDRASACGGLLQPVGLLQPLSPREQVLYRCASCGAARRCKTAPDDDRAALQRLAGQPLPADML